MAKFLVVTFPGLVPEEQDFEIRGSAAQLKLLTQCLLKVALYEKYPPFCRIEQKEEEILFSQIG